MFVVFITWEMMQFAVCFCVPVCLELSKVLTSRAYFNSLSLCRCLPLDLCRPPFSGGVAGAEGAAHRPPGGAGDHRQHRGGLLLQRLLRHGAARTGGQILSV